MSQLIDNPKPHPRVGVCVIIRKEGRVLMGKRKGAHGGDTWAPPGGHLEFGESWEECAERETLEETGLQIKVVGLGTVTNDIFAANNKHYITIVMITDYVSGEPQLLEPDKCTEWRWCSWDDLPLPLFPPVQNAQNQGFSPFN